MKTLKNPAFAIAEMAWESPLRLTDLEERIKVMESRGTDPFLQVEQSEEYRRFMEEYSRRTGMDLGQLENEGISAVRNKIHALPIAKSIINEIRSVMGDTSSFGKVGHTIGSNGKIRHQLRLQLHQKIWSLLQRVDRRLTKECSALQIIGEEGVNIAMQNIESEKIREVTVLCLREIFEKITGENVSIEMFNRAYDRMDRLEIDDDPRQFLPHAAMMLLRKRFYKVVGFPGANMDTWF